MNTESRLTLIVACGLVLGLGLTLATVTQAATLFTENFSNTGVLPGPNLQQNIVDGVGGGSPRFRNL